MLKKYNLFSRERVSDNKKIGFTFIGLLTVIAITTVVLMGFVESDTEMMIGRDLLDKCVRTKWVAWSIFLPLLATSNIYLMFVLPFVVEKKEDLLTYLYTIAVFVTFIVTALFGIASSDAVLAVIRVTICIAYFIFTAAFNHNKGGLLSCIDVGVVTFDLYKGTYILII